MKLHILQSAQQPVSIIDGKKVINLTSNNYLCLTTHPKVKAAAIAATRKWGVGSAAVRSIIGTMSIHDELEKRLAEFKGTAASVLLQSGFSTNTAVCQTLMNSPEDLLISDELNHASIIDGARLAKAARKIYAHSDMRYFIVSESYQEKVFLEIIMGVRYIQFFIKGKWKHKKFITFTHL